MMQRTAPLILTLFLTTAVLTACSDSGTGASGPPAGGASAERPPAPVSVMSMKLLEQPLTTVLPGRASAFQTAEIRPRVSGVIKEIAFREGSEVKAGDLLYQIEDDTYAAQVAEAQATVAKAEASIPSALANLARYERLVNSGATQIEYENAKVTLLQAQADVAQSKAALQSAQINLDLTKIRAPFDGYTSISRFSIGNVVTANQADALTTLRKLDPIYIDLIESSANLLRMRNAISAGRVAGGEGAVDIELTLEDGTTYANKGKLDMSDMAVSETTGTYSIRAQFENPRDLILPGTYVRATVKIGTESGFIIPQRASDRNAMGQLTAKFVSADNKVETRSFDNARQSGSNWLVNANVNEGDKLILDGFQWIADGATVAPVEAMVNDSGIVETVQADAPKPVEAK